MSHPKNEDYNHFAPNDYIRVHEGELHLTLLPSEEDVEETIANVDIKMAKLPI